MKNKLPYGNNREADASSRVQRVAGFARGGAVADEGTRINITIGQPTGPNANGPAIMPPPPPPAKPPMPPMAPGAPPGAPPPGLGALGGLGAMPGMKTGGAVKKDGGGPAGTSSGASRLRRSQDAD